MMSVLCHYCAKYCCECCPACSGTAETLEKYEKIIRELAEQSDHLMCVCANFKDCKHAKLIAKAKEAVK